MRQHEARHFPRRSPRVMSSTGGLCALVRDVV